MKPTYREFLDVATTAAEAGGEILRKYWGRLSMIKEKGHPSNLVTEADQESEQCIIAYLQKHFPQHGILAEESGRHEGKDPDLTWAVDPLDGTTNYTHQFPMVSVSIALLYRGDPIVGVVYNPILKQLFQTAKGEGAYCNGTELSVSQVSELSHSLLVTGFPYNRHEIIDNNYLQFSQLTHLTQGVRRMGSAALDLCYVAAGKFDGYWEKGLGAWDISAGALMVLEAGGMVTACDQSPLNVTQGNILATNGKLHAKLSKALRKSPIPEKQG